MMLPGSFKAKPPFAGCESRDLDWAATERGEPVTDCISGSVAWSGGWRDNRDENCHEFNRTFHEGGDRNG
jgi:hypothetical protein